MYGGVGKVYGDDYSFIYINLFILDTFIHIGVRSVRNVRHFYRKKTDVVPFYTFTHITAPFG